MSESHYTPSNSHIGKKRVEPARNWLVTMAYKLQIKVSGVVGLLSYPVDQKVYPAIKEKFG